MHFKLLFVYFLSFLLLTISCQLTHLSEDSILVKNINIINIEDGAISEPQSILIENGRISRIFRAGAIAYATKHEIDATGKFAISGLWDMHIHLRGGKDLIDENKNLLPLYIAHGVTTVRDAGGDITPEVLEWKSQITNNALVGPTIFTSGPKIDGKNSTWAGSLEVQTKEDVTNALDSLQALNVDYVKIYDSRLSEKLYLEILKQAEARGMKTTGHMPLSVMLDDAIDAGLDGIDHLYYVMKGASSKEAEITAKVRAGTLNFWSAVRELQASYDEDKAKKLFQKLAQNNVAVTPTLHIGEVLSYLQEVDHSNDPELKYIGSGIQATYSGRLNSALKKSKAANAFDAKLNNTFKSMIKPMFDAKVTLLTGSDNGAYNSFVYAGSSLHKELQQFVDAGLTPIEALQSSILNGARFFGVQDSIGTIVEGKKGDLIILNQNPLLNIEHTTSIETVIHNGMAYSREDLDLLLKEISDTVNKK